MRGLGDLIARGASALGIKQTPGCGCARRQATLNRWVPFGSSGLVTSAGPYVRTARKSGSPISGGSGTEEAICDNPDVLFCDNFNSRALGDVRFTSTLGQNLGNKTIGWGWDQSPGQEIVTGAECMDGNCFRQTYPALTTSLDPNASGGGFIATNPFPQSQTIFYRTWLKMPTNFQYVFAGKYLYGAGPNQRSEVGLGTFGNPMHVYFEPLGQEPNMNFNQAILRLGTWQCFEFQFTSPTAQGRPDGAFRGWTNDPSGGADIQIFDLPNIDYGGSNYAFGPFDNGILSSYLNCLCRRGPRGESPYPPSGYTWQCDSLPHPTNPCDFAGGTASCDNAQQCMDPQNGHPQWFRYNDKIVISRSRIGCGGFVPPPPGPAAPTITITSPTSSSTYLTRTSPL